jgi:hypothetical protein
MHTWIVWQNNRFAGYVEAASEREAYDKAKNKYGSYVWVEKVPDKCLS